MEMDHDTGVCSDAFHRLGVSVRYASSALKELVHAWTHGDFSLAHYVVHMPQRRALCRGEAGEVEIVWIHLDRSSRSASSAYS